MLNCVCVNANIDYLVRNGKIEQCLNARQLDDLINLLIDQQQYKVVERSAFEVDYDDELKCCKLCCGVALDFKVNECTDIHTTNFYMLTNGDILMCGMLRTEFDCMYADDIECDDSYDIFVSSIFKLVESECE